MTAVLCALAVAVPSPTSIGRGAAQAWIFPPAGPAKSVVVFAHGWSTPLPDGPFAPWIAHLQQRGSYVVYPRYRVGTTSTSEALAAFRAGVVAALHRIAAPRLPIVALGKSFGGSAVFYYAAEARRWHVRGPRAVVSIFPAGPIGGFPPDPLPAGIRVRILVGDRDTVAGSSGANAFRGWLGARPIEYAVVRSRAGFVADHDSAQRSDAASRHVFWRPFDRLLAGLATRRRALRRAR